MVKLIPASDVDNFVPSVIASKRIPLTDTDAGCSPISFFMSSLSESTCPLQTENLSPTGAVIAVLPKLSIAAPSESATRWSDPPFIAAADGISFSVLMLSVCILLPFTAVFFSSTGSCFLVTIAPIGIRSSESERAEAISGERMNRLQNIPSIHAFATAIILIPRW